MSIVPGAVSVVGMAFSGTLGAAVGVRTVFVVSGVILAAGTGLVWCQFRQTRSPVHANSRLGSGPNRS